MASFPQIYDNSCKIIVAKLSTSQSCGRGRGGGGGRGGGQGTKNKKSNKNSRGTAKPSIRSTAGLSTKQLVQQSSILSASTKRKASLSAGAAAIPHVRYSLPSSNRNVNSGVKSDSSSSLMPATDTIDLSHLPDTKEQTLVNVLSIPYWIHSQSDGSNWNAFELVISGDNGEDRTCPYCLNIKKSKGISRHAKYCTKNEKKK